MLHAPAAIFLVSGFVYTSLALFLSENAGNVVNFVLLQATPILGNRSGEMVQEKAEYHILDGLTEYRYVSSAQGNRQAEISVVIEETANTSGWDLRLL